MQDKPVTTCFWGHQWGKWKQMVYPLIEDGKKTGAQATFNERFCERCNKMQRKEV